MPAYGDPNQNKSIEPGMSEQVITTADVLQNAAFISKEVALVGPVPTAGRRVYVEGGPASGAIGVFEVDVQEAWTDVDARFVTVQKITVANSKDGLGFSADLTDVISGRFVRLSVPTWPNAVTCPMTIGQQP